jgi:enoyl-CoA hydratase/carnithine racemase
MNTQIEIGRDGTVLTLRMARPEKKNALTAAMYDALATAIAAADRDTQTHAILILGQPGVFCAGNDMQDFLKAAMQGTLDDAVIRFLKAIAGGSKPLVAGVDGLAIGVGTTMLFHCDYVVASEKAMLRMPFTDLALVPEAGSSLLGPRLMGAQRAFEYLVMGRAMDARKAEAFGLINAVTTSEALEETALAAAREIAGKPPGAVQASRRLLRGDTEAVLRRIDEEAEIFKERLRSPEALAAFQAFMSRR